MQQRAEAATAAGGGSSGRRCARFAQRWVAWVATATAALLLACSGSEGGEDLGRLTQRLSDSDRVLGFETPIADWSSPQVAVGESDIAAQGEHALSITPSGWTEISSIPLGSLGTVGDTASFDLQVSGPVAWGEARVILKIPSLGVHWADLGTQALTGLAPNVFHRLEFPLGSIREDLTSTYEDLQIVLVLNLTASGPVLVDGFSFGGETGPTQKLLEVALPVGTSLDQVALAGSSTVYVGSQSVINGQVVNSGLGALEIAASATSGPVRSRGPLLLRDSALVDGNALTASTADLQNGVVITGSLLENYPMDVRTEVRWETQVPEETGPAVQLQPGAVQHIAPDPSRATSLQVHPGARAIFSSGQYHLKSLTVSAEGILEVDDTSSSPVIIYVQDELDFHGSIRHPLDGTTESVAAPQLLIVHLGTSSAYVRSPFRGTMLSSESDIVLATYEGVPHEASFFAQGIQVQGSVAVNAASFDWTTIEQLRRGSPTDYGAFNLLVPRGTNIHDVVVGARRGMTIASNAEVTGQESSLVTVAEGSATIQGGHTVGVVAHAGAVVEAGSVVDGDLVSSAPSVVSGTVTGDILDGQLLSPPDAHAVPFVFPPPDGGNILVRAGRSRIVWPGNYGTLNVEGGGRIYLTTGQYQFASAHIASGAEVFVNTHEGPVQMLVSVSLKLEGELSGFGQADAELFVGYAGVRPVEVRGTFRGALVAPNAPVTVGTGEHEGFFYGDSVVLESGARVATGYTPWGDLLPADDPDESLASDEAGGVLVATDTTPGVLDLPGGFELRIPARIPVRVGNAGNHDAILRYTIGGTEYSCLYRGGATVSHPTSLLELARGRAYRFDSCTDGSSPGTVHVVSSVELEIDADGQADGGKTEAVLGAGDTCDNYLEPAIPADLSREMIEAFSWPSQGVVERTSDDRPALYYANIYITNRDELARLDALLIHWQTKPLFATELPDDLVESCGTVSYEGDGEGMWVFAVLPGATYNALLDARTHPDIPSEEREIFRAVQLRTPPPGTADANGAIEYSVLQDAGFHYMNVAELPDDLALEDAVFPARAGSKIVNAARFVFDKAKTAVREVLTFTGWVDGLFAGTVNIDVNLKLENLDGRFSTPTNLRNPRAVLRAWGPNAGREIAAEGVRATMYNLVVRPWTIFPVPTASSAYMDSSGRARFKVPKGGGGLQGTVELLTLCYELRNRAGEVTSFLVADELCMSRSRFNFGNFTADRTIDKRVVNYPLWVQTEMTDSFQYLQQMVGITAKQAKMLRGFNASVISGFDSLAWAPCLGYGNLAAEVVLDLLLPGVPLAALYLEILAESDIIITPGYAPARQRGLVTHEYGHYALCAMADQLTGSIFQDVVLTWDTVLAGPGNPGPGDEARVINEAFADFFTGQVVGGYNYFTVAGANQGDVNISVAPLGLDRNLVARNSGGNVIGVFATLLQDVFDGHAKTFEGTVRRGTGPGSGDFWQVPDPDLPNEGPILWSNRTDGDLDPERVRLPGQDIAKFTRIFFDERNILGAYRYDAFERAVERVMRERGETWCQRCLVMAPHFVTGFEGEFETVGDERVLDLDQKVREILESCVANSRLAELLGPPPRPLDSMDGHDCVLCPSTHGMGADGRCTECVADVQLDWGSLAASGAECLQHEVPWSSATGDNCPSQLVVEVTGARDGVRLSTVTPSATPAPADQGACESSVLRGLISQADEYPPVALEPRTFHVPGLWSNAPLLRGCHVGGTDGHPVDGEVDGEYVRVSADAGELNASLTLRSYCPPVIVR